MVFYKAQITEKRQLPLLPRKEIPDHLLNTGEPEPQWREGIGAFFYPDALTVHNNNATLEDPPAYHSRTVAFTHTLNDGTNVVVTDDGFIGILNTDVEKAVSLLNTIFATGLTWSLKSDFIVYLDTCHFRWYHTLGKIWINTYHIPSERVMFALLRDEPHADRFGDWQVYERRLLKPETCRNILDRAYEYSTRPELHEDLIILFQGYTLYGKEAYRGAFLYGWMIIETFLAELWKNHVDSLERSSKDKESLRDFRSWTSYHHIEMFSAIGKMPPVVRNLLNKLRKRRNEIVHEKDMTLKQESFGCLDVARRILLNRLHSPQTPFKGLEENSLVRIWKCETTEK